ncbi:MAG: cytolysin immunity CylI protein [Bryobacterales bacterium]|nr:cytolysin immunity CylI protein [Bryobacterales bacterium]
MLLIPALYVAIAFHEIGHFVAGKLVGLDAGGISVGAFVFTKSGKNWVFRFDRRMCFGGFFKPLTGTVDFHPSRYVWLVAGGPFASIVLAGLCGSICVQYGSGAWDWIGCLFWTSLFIVIISGIPYSGGLNKSDGARLWQLIRYPERARSWIALLTLQTEEAKGLRPHEWNPQLFEQILTVDATANEYLYCQLMAFYRRLDEGREAGALEHLENALVRSAGVGKPLRHALFLEAASASANIRKQAAQARSWRERACKLRKPESLDVVDAGIAMCEGRYEEAVQHWEAARAHIVRRRLDSGLIRFAKEKWAEYEAACRTACG